MGNIIENVANNISRLRKSANLTQIELANKLSYSDKAISKWERGESLPDIEVLNTIAHLFNVDLNYLVSEHDDTEFLKKDEEEKHTIIREALVLTLWCIAAYFVAIVTFIYVHLANISNAHNYWVGFVIASALSALMVLRYSFKKKNELLLLISGSLSAWLVIASVFCVTFVLNMSNVWMLFLIGLPIQASLFISYFMRRAK